MKGIAHFSVGVAAASCVPAAVEAGASGNPLYFILGGVFGLLPDTIDFKFFRFFYRQDMEVRPDPLEFDGKMVAHGVACAVNRAHDTGKKVRLKLSTVQLDEELWQSYRVEFNVAGKRVEVTKGPAVDTGGNVDSTIEGERVFDGPVYKARLDPEIKLEYFASTTVDILDGPVFEFVPTSDSRKVMVHFLPWHRSWTHSLVIALLFGLAGAVIWGAWAGLVVFLAYALHILLDQLGFMGSNLFFPFTKHRSAGAMKLHSGDAIWNFASVWMSCLIIFWNLYASAGWRYEGFTGMRLFFYGAVLPWFACAVVKRRSECSRIND